MSTHDSSPLSIVVCTSLIVASTQRNGVVVGSALVDALHRSLVGEGRAGPGTVEAVAGLVRALADGVRSAGRR